MARSFNGSTSVLKVDDVTSIRVAAPMSVSMWWRATAGSSAFEYIMSKPVAAGDHASYAFGFNSNNRPRFLIGWGANPSEFISTSDQLDDHGVGDGNWHLWTGTYDGTVAQIYIDNIFHSNVTESHTIVYASFPLFFGSFDGTQLWNKGDIAEACLWSDVLTSAQVNQLYLGFSPELVRPDKLVHHWQMEGLPDPDYDVDLRAGVHAYTTTNAPRVDHPNIRRPVQPIYYTKAGTSTSGARSRFMPFF